MVQLARTRTALLLYAILVVLPTGVFGGLHWHQLVTGHGNELAAIPDEANGAAQRLENRIEDEVEKLLAREAAQPFYVYRQEYWQESTNEGFARIASHLALAPPPPGIQTYFCYEFQLGEDAEFAFFPAMREGEEWEAQRQAYKRVLRTFMREWEARYNAAGQLLGKDSASLGVDVQHPTTLRAPLGTVAINLSDGHDQESLSHALLLLRENGPEYIEYDLFDFEIFAMRDENGERFVFARRLVDFDPKLSSAIVEPCFEQLEQKTTLAQGFFLEPDYLFETLPRAVAAEVLDGASQRLVLGPKAMAAVSPQAHMASFDLAEEIPLLRLLHSEAPDALRMGVVVDAGELATSFRRQSLWFLGVAGMMVVSLAVGMGLLVHSVSASLERARRTENFVAAVTHELRTPIAAVKMYGEMLREGWVKSPEKQHEYYERIVRETNRLDALVDRVLQKRRLGAGTPDPEPGDLSGEIEAMIPDLVLTAGTYGEDLEFDLAPDLPPVLLLTESVQAVVGNLVENARKYAPAPPGGERIRVATRKLKGEVVLEVSDRGPGIAEAERTRIFDAFYRIGDERTRTRPGTGLGLHIVHLQVQAMRAKVAVLPRKGGGSTFRVTFRRA